MILLTVTATMMGQARELSSLFLIGTLCVLIGSTVSLELTVTPGRRNVRVGDDAEFLCSYKPDYAPSCDDTFVFWGKKGGNTIANMTFTINKEKYDVVWESTFDEDGDLLCLYTLVIKDVMDEDGGQYSCALVRPQSGRFYIAQDLGKLQVVIPPSDIYPICRTSVVTGMSLTEGMALICESEVGQPQVSLTWFHERDELPAELHKVKGNNLLQLQTTMTQLDMDRLSTPLIVCVMELPDPINDFRTCSINASTSVAVRPKIARITSPTQIATFVCHVTTSIPYEIDWYFQDQLINAHNPNDQFFVETEAKALHIQDIRSEDDGSVVTCVAVTMFGNFTGTAMLSVEADNDPNTKALLPDRGNAFLIVGLIIGSLVLIVIMNVIICYKCKRQSSPSRSAKRSSMLGDECTPMSPTPQPIPVTNQEKVTVVSEMETRSDSQYLDMHKPLRKVAANNNTHYSPMKSLEKQPNDNKNVSTEDNDNEYIVSSKSDDASTYMYSSTDALDKAGKSKNNQKPTTPSKPTKFLQDVSTPTKDKPSSQQNTKENAGNIKAVRQQISPATLSDNDDANDYEILAKEVKQSPGTPKLHKMKSQGHSVDSTPHATNDSPKLMRNLSAPLLGMDQSDYEYAVPNEAVPQKSKTSSAAAPVYDIPNENLQRTNKINDRISNFERAADKSTSPLLKIAKKPPVLHKKNQRHSDPPSSCESEPSPKRNPIKNRASASDAEGPENQYLVPSVSMQSLDKIKATTPPAKEVKSPLLKKVKNPFKPKINNKDTYQCLDRKSMELESPGYQVLLGKANMAKVDDSLLYENVGSSAVA